jgi:hypothetical protein
VCVVCVCVAGLRAIQILKQPDCVQSEILRNRIACNMCSRPPGAIVSKALEGPTCELA